MSERISILGCGWYGFPMAEKLIEKGFEVKGSATSEEKLGKLFEKKIKGYLVKIDSEDLQYDPNFFDCEILIISIPPKSKSPELKDFQSKIDFVVAEACQHQIKQVIFISSSGVYQDGNFIVDETIVPIPDTEVGKTLIQVENSLLANRSFTTTIIRFTGLIGPNRNLAKFFAGKSGIPNGSAPINLIHLDDCLGITLAIIKQKAFGQIYHGVTPFHPTREEFYTKACLASGFEPPSFSSELENWKQIESVNVPKLLNYKFSVTNWQSLIDN